MYQKFLDPLINIVFQTSQANWQINLYDINNLLE